LCCAWVMVMGKDKWGKSGGMSSGSGQAGRRAVCSGARLVVCVCGISVEATRRRRRVLYGRSGWTGCEEGRHSRFGVGLRPQQAQAAARQRSKWG
jgi:hypothetical protein